MSDEKPVGHLRRDMNGDMTVTMSGITNERYLKQSARIAAAKERDPVYDKTVELLDAYVKAYDQRQRYGVTPIARDPHVDRTYNFMLRQESERANAFVNRCVNAPDDARPGLGIRMDRRDVRDWLRQVAEAEPGEKRDARRRMVLSEIKRLSKEHEP